MHAAARRGNENTLQSLLISGCSRNMQDNDGNTALHLAAILGISSVDALLSNGQQIFPTTMDKRPLKCLRKTHSVHLYQIIWGVV